MNIHKILLCMLFGDSSVIGHAVKKPSCYAIQEGLHTGTGYPHIDYRSRSAYHTMPVHCTMPLPHTIMRGAPSTSVVGLMVRFD